MRQSDEVAIDLTQQLEDAQTKVDDALWRLKQLQQQSAWNIINAQKDYDTARAEFERLRQQIEIEP